MPLREVVSQAFRLDMHLQALEGRRELIQLWRVVRVVSQNV